MRGTLLSWIVPAAVLALAGVAGADVRWREDMRRALAEARSSNKPLFVTMRCLPCKQCSDFDKDVLEGGSELDPLLEQFVTVRLTSMRDVDLRMFPVEEWQDLDLSWWGWFLSPQGRVWGVFGGRDHVSDATRVSIPALQNTLRRVLAHHADPARAAAEAALPELSFAGAAQTPRDLPGFESWARRGGGAAVAKDNCMHCHQVIEVLRQGAMDAGTFDKARDLAVWPLPENVGIVVDRDDGLLVREVRAASAAAKAGVRAGDRLVGAGGRVLFGQADLRGALHRGPKGAGTVELSWRRGDAALSGTLELKEGWRETPLAWRHSIADGNIGAHPGFAWALEVKADQRRKLGVPAGSMAVKPFFGKNRDDWPSQAAGLGEGDVIVAVGGKSPDLFGREFMAWFRLAHEPGDAIRLTVRDARGRDREVRYTALDR